MGAVTKDVVSKRKPFSVGARVERQADGERGTVESVQSYEGVWAVAVRMDSDGQTWSGTQKTAARGAWTRLSGDAPHVPDCECDDCENAPFLVSAPSAPVLDEGTLYLAYDRYVCGRVECCGMQALYTGVTIGGATVVPVNPNTVRQTLTCECGAVTMTLVPNKRARKAPTAADVARTLDALAATSAPTEALSAALATQEKRSARRSPCDWVDCKSSATTTRVLAGQTWNVCGPHA